MERVLTQMKKNSHSRRISSKQDIIEKKFLNLGGATV